jgi:hypothetical protein
MRLLYPYRVVSPGRGTVQPSESESRCMATGQWTCWPPFATPANVIEPL